MTQHPIDDLRIVSLEPLISPAVLHYFQPVTPEVSRLISNVRREVEAIIHGHDDRLLLVVGPCSIHDPEAALEYGGRLKRLIDKHRGELLLLMRVYFEKPRTTVGWKGLINDPGMDGSFDINKGLQIARGLLLNLAKLGVSAGTEFLDTISPQFFADLITWAAIGARTTESQVHRELASGLSMSVGFKNGTGGSIQIALDAITSASRPHHFLSVTKQGVSAIVSTRGNENCHLIMRGGKSGPNYMPESIEAAVNMLENQGLSPHVMVDCSHGNSEKDYRRQPLVAASICEQVAAGSRAIVAAMIESNLLEGCQKISADPSHMVRGQSVTDACISWEATEELVQQFAEAVIARRKA